VDSCPFAVRFSWFSDHGFGIQQTRVSAVLFVGSHCLPVKTDAGSIGNVVDFLSKPTLPASTVPCPDDLASTPQREESTQPAAMSQFPFDAPCEKRGSALHGTCREIHMLIGPCNDRWAGQNCGGRFSSSFIFGPR
jgi:hypothetical protein